MKQRGNSLAEILIFLVFVFFICCCMVTAQYFLAKKSCYARWENSGMEVRYGLWEDCIVKFNGMWIPDKTVRMVGE